MTVSRLRHNLVRVGLLVLGHGTGTAQAQAQDDAEALAGEQAPELRRYNVEFIVFRYAEPMSVGTEVFIPDIVEPPPNVPDGFALDENGNLVPLPANVPDGFALDDNGNLVPLPDAETVDDANDAGTTDELLTDAELLDGPLEPVFEMVVTPEDELMLGNYWDAFERLDVYEPLLHGGWTQTALPEEDVLAIDIREFGEPPAGLAGELTLYLSRFLHLVVDLELLAPDAEQPYPYLRSDRRDDEFTTPVPVFSDRGRNEPGIEAFDVGVVAPETLYAPLRYRIDENRIFRSEEVRYYDHPRFGVIAKVVRVEEAGVDEEFPDDTEFLLPPETSAGGQ